MKTKRFIYLLGIAVLFASCATTSTTFYQVYNVKPTDDNIIKTDELVYEDDYCKISYNLWENGGNIGFNIYNKTDKELYVHLKKCNFVLNGFAYDYYKNRTYTTSESQSSSTTKTALGSVAVTGINVYNNIQTNQLKSANSANQSSSVGYTVSVKEDSIVRIPGKTTKQITEYSINNNLIRNCDLLKYPKTGIFKQDEVNTKKYSMEQSPIVFSNRITYKVGDEFFNIENRFFVSEITNYPSTEFIESKYEEYCGHKSLAKTKYYKYYDTDKFFIKYNKGNDYMKH
jgi:hypothetical protein